MGLDLSTTAMGYAIIDRRSADLDEIGEVKFRGRNWLNRIPPIKETLAEIVKSRVLDEDRAIIEAAIEWPILAYHTDKYGRPRPNPDSIVKQGIFIGVAVALLQAYGVSVPYLPNPTKVKVALTSFPYAKKEDMRAAAKLICGYDPGEHAADALGVAYELRGWLNVREWNELG